MPLIDLRTYHFNRTAHWAICGRDGFVLDGDHLTLGGGGAWQPLSVAAEDRRPLAIAATVGGSLAWLRSSGELVVHRDGMVLVFGVLEVNGPAGSPGAPGDRRSTCLALGDERIWLASGEYLRIYHELHLQLLSEQRIGPAKALAIDHAGAWCLVDAGTRACRWIHLDRSGMVDRPEVPCSDGGPPLSGALDPSSGRLLIVDEKAVRGRDPCANDWAVDVDLRPFRCYFEPDCIAVDCKGTVHLLDRARGVIWSFAAGVRVAQRDAPAKDAQSGHGEGLIAAAVTLAFGGAGVFHLVEPASASVEAAESASREAVLLTPTLISPRDQSAGWQRARIGADLPPGTALRVRVAASDDDALRDQVAAIAARSELSATQRLMMIEGLLPWDDRFETILAPADDPLKLGSFDVLLDGITVPYLWLALQLHAPPTSPPARLRSLEVRYPARSWIEDLPAIYRTEPLRAAELRRFLAALETVFDRLEESIGKLPERVSATSRDEVWLLFLLRWLGLPLPRDLPAGPKQEFLVEAPELLRRRGTPWALERALRIVTGQEVRIVDRGAEPLPWVLSSEDARLGQGSLLIRQDRLGFTLGCEARLGHDGLGRHVPSAAERVAQWTQVVRIEVGARAEDNGAARAGIELVLDHFLPAACRYELSAAPLGLPRQGRRLDHDARLARGRGTEVGRAHTLDRTSLGGARPPELRLDHRASLDGRHRLS